MEGLLPKVVHVGIYNASIAQKGKKISRNRKTTMFELELPMEDGGVSHIDRESAPITGRMLICAKPNQTRHTRFPFTCRYVHIIVPEGILRDILMRAPAFFYPVDITPYSEIFDGLCRYGGSALKRDEIMLQSYLLRLIYLIGEQQPTEGAPSLGTGTGREVIEDTVAYIEENLTGDLSLAALASRAGFTPTYFHHFFKRATGRTLRDYVEERRIRRAVTMILASSATLTEIAYDCGFSSQSYFSYAFKRRMGKTPRAYARDVFRQYESKKEQ